MKNQKKTKPKNEQRIHKRESSYGGYGGNSSANMNGAINEFEDNLTVDLTNDFTDEDENLSETNRLDTETETDSSSGKKEDGLNKNRAEGFDKIKKDNKTDKKSKNKSNAN